MTDYEVFKKQILELTGIDLNAYKERQMKRRITTLSLKYGFQTYEEFYQDLKKNAERRKQFLNYLTINVSEFYRNPMQWQTLEEKVIPDLIEENKGELRIWSAACSTGDEPYTIIMMMKEKFPKVPVKLLATDLDDEVLAFAKQGLYPQKSLTNLPEKYIQKYFREIKPGYYQIAESIMKEVEFRQHNLLADPYGKNYDLIVCRNGSILQKRPRSKSLKSFISLCVRMAICSLAVPSRFCRHAPFILNRSTHFFIKKKR